MLFPRDDSSVRVCAEKNITIQTIQNEIDIKTTVFDRSSLARYCAPRVPI